jgi:hypothetical protein
MDNSKIQSSFTHGSNGHTEKVNPFLACWTKPAATIKYIFPYWGDRFMHRLFMARGTTIMACLRMPWWVQNGADPIELAILLLLVGPIAGLFYGYATGSIFVWLVPKFGGRDAGHTGFRICTAWSLPWPVLGGVACTLICWLLFPEELPLPKPPVDYFSVSLGFGLMGCTMIISFFQRSISISAVSGLPLSRSLAVNLIAFFVFSVPASLVVGMYTGILTSVIDF